MDRDSSEAPIDHFFLTKDVFEPLSFTIHRDKYGENNDKFLSDHYPVSTRVKWYIK